MNTTSLEASAPDSELIAKARMGDTAAFGSLVARHQSGACGIAYAACGDFAASEDIAQEAFIAAWKRIRDLREPMHFRSWVCGISRRLALSRMRVMTRRGEHTSLSPAADREMANDDPRKTAVSADEKAMLWRVLDGMPPTYREPLVLFYREQQSIQSVAEALDLSPEVVRQRLSRGRTLLREEMSRILEGVLGATRPGAAFTLGVVGSLPPIIGASGLALGGAGAKATSSAKAATSLAATGFSAMLGSLASALVGMYGFYVLYRLWSWPLLSPASRRALVRYGVAWFGASVILAAGIAWFAFFARGNIAFVGISPGAALAYAVVGFVSLNLWLSIATALRIQQMQREELAGPRKSDLWFQRMCRRRYRSAASFLGLPLVSLAFGPDPATGESRGHARGWFAFGDVAVGGVAAVGGFVCAPVAVGIGAVGILAVGSGAIAVFALAGISVGWVSISGAAVGWACAIGGLAIANDVAIGGVAIARHWALGGVAFAQHANSEATYAALLARPFLGHILPLLPYAGWLSLIGIPGMWTTLRMIRQTSRDRS